MEKTITMYQVDAFSETLFSGNPAAVIVRDEWLSDELMQQIAAENNLSETAFVLKGDPYQIRWFTPLSEVDLCGHATLASAHVIFNHLKLENERIDLFSHRSGPLSVTRSAELMTLDFPADVPAPAEAGEGLVRALGISPLEVYRGKTDLLLVFGSQTDIESMDPDMSGIAQFGGRGVIVTAPGESADFVSRFFAPNVGVDEDPVTGSAHTLLTPYWQKRLDKNPLSAKQLSKRGGELMCDLQGDRVHISGKAVTYLIGEIQR